MHDISVNELQEMSRGEIERVMGRLQEELDRRRRENREILIQNFKEAFYALKDERIVLSYCDGFEGESIKLDDAECFYFN